MLSAGLIAGTMLEYSDRTANRGPISMASALLSLSYHMVSVRWLAASTNKVDPELAERARELVGDKQWLEELSGVVFEAPLLSLAQEVWEDERLWDEMDSTRTDVWIRLERFPDVELDDAAGAESLREETFDTDALLGSYSFSANELGEDVPDVDAAIKALLVPIYGEELALDSPVLEAFCELLGRMVDAKTVFPVGHASRVANMVREVAILLELDDDKVNQLRVAAWLYGVGKLALPSALLEQGGGLRSDQLSLLTETPRITRTTLSPLCPLNGLIDGVSDYAERLDGSGYPKGLRGDEIPLAGRLLAVVDSFEAMQCDRPYRPAYSRARALHILQAQSGKLLDGVITDLVEGIARGEL
jgi:HD-GYP domain-containing protein (c-di-GMP phosphodiesterase class II)